MRFLHLFTMLTVVALLGACISGQGGGSSPSGPDNQGSNNVLLIVMDDVGVDQIAAYGYAGHAQTPNIDKLVEKGVTFTKAWACPTCSPTRACMLSGQFPYRTGIGYALLPNAVNVLPANSHTLPRAWAADGVEVYTAMIGKWHVSHQSTDPNTFGFNDFFGIMQGGVIDYSKWNLVNNGTQISMETYVTSTLTNAAIDWIQSHSDRPWFVAINHIAAHDPMHLPPSGTYTDATLTGTEDDIINRERDYFQAIIENMDNEIGRLIDGLGDQAESTTIILIGDNGTQGDKVAAPLQTNRAKGSLYEGGIRVPLIIAGAGVSSPGRVCEHLIHAVDLYATIQELAGGSPMPQSPPGIEIDSKSFVAVLRDPGTDPVRHLLFTEQFGARVEATNGRCMRDDIYKLIHFDTTGVEELYDLSIDPLETMNLLPATPGSAAAAAYDRLKEALNAIPVPAG